MCGMVCSPAVLLRRMCVVKRKLLLPAPRARDAAEFWRMACVGLLLFGTAGLVGSYGLGLQHARAKFVEQVHSADYYAGLVEQCRDTLERTLSASETAASLLARRQLLQSWVLHLTRPRGDYVVQMD